jgi:ribose transport system substrate-binding protein
MTRTPHRRPLFIALALAVAIIPIAVAVSGAGAAQQKTIRIGLVLPLLSNPFIAPVRDGAVAEAKKLGNIQVLSTGTNIPAEQLNAMKTYLDAKVDVLMFDPIDSSAIAPAVQQANAAGVPVIGVIGGSAKGKLSTLITPDWYKAGYAAGRQVATGWCKKLNPCKVGLVAGTNAPGPGLDSGKGMIAGVESNPHAQLVQTVYTDYSAEQSLKAAQQILTGHPDLNFLMAWWSVGTLSTESAIRTANLADKVGTNSLTGACPVLQGLLDGTVYNDVMMFSELMGKAGVDAAVKLVAGKKVPAKVISPNYPITKSQADALLSGKRKPPASMPVLQHLQAAKAGCK